MILLRTFSKIAALAGLRVGYAIGSPEAIDRLNRVRAPYNVNRLGQIAALAALDDPAHWERTRQVVIEERAFLSAELARRGLTFPPSQANFFLVKVPGRLGGARAAAARRAGRTRRCRAGLPRSPAHRHRHARDEHPTAGALDRQ
jgi:histidinol-phosphate/aromatic aminotransferase/cobyric acid decarboxylase-like protein